MPMNTPQTLIAVVGASVLSSVLTATFADHESKTSPSAAALSSIGEQLEGLAAEVRELKQHSGVGVAAVGTVDSSTPRAPVDGPEDRAALLRELAELKELVQTLTWRSGSAAEDLSRLSKQHQDANWTSLTALQERRSVSDEVKNAAERELFFLTATQVLEKFGRPTAIVAHPGGNTVWVFKKGALDPSGSVDIAFVIKDGFLVEVI